MILRKSITASILVTTLMVLAMLPMVAFAEGDDSGEGGGSTGGVSVILDFGANHAAFAQQCAGDRFTVNGSEVTIPLRNDCLDKQSAILYLENLSQTDDLGFRFKIDNGVMASRYVGAKSGYASGTEYFEERDSLAQEQVNDGDRFYVLWNQPIKSIKATLTAPMCGTEVEITYPSMYRGSNPQPNITLEGPVSIETVAPPARWAKDSTYWYEEAFEGTMQGGETYYFEFGAVPDFGYFFTDNTRFELEGGTVTKFRITTEESTSLSVRGTVTAKHVVYNPTIVKATPTSNGSMTGTCSACGNAVEETLYSPNGFKLSNAKYTYNGKAQKPSVTVTDANGKLVEASNYTVSYKNNTKAGTATATVTFKGEYYEGAKALNYTIAKASNPLKVKAKGKTAKVSRAKLQSKAQTLKASKLIKVSKKGQGTMRYKLASAKQGKKSFKKYFKVNAKNGKVTVKKGLKKGTYTVKIKVKAAGNANYKASGWKTTTCKVKVV